MATSNSFQARTISLSAGHASFIEAGRGPAVLCVHGLPGRAQDFRWLFAPLAERARVIAIDLPGFGGTPVETAPDASPEGRAAFVLDVIDALGVEHPVIIGHSMGGLVAVAAIAMRRDGFRALGLISSPGLRPHASFKRVPRRFLHLATTGALAPLMRPLVRRLFAFAGFRNYPDSALARTVACLRVTSIEAHAARLRTMTLPTLAAWCEDDKLIEPAILSELAASLPAGPRLVWPTGGHVPQKTHAAEVADGIAALLLG